MFNAGMMQATRSDDTGDSSVVRGQGAVKSMAAMATAILLALAAGGVQAKAPKHPSGDQPGHFDYYALSLSWSPNFCASHADPAQCGTGKQFGFVVHGLWPQYAKGYPESCSTQKLTPELKEKYGPIFASPTLINHEWPKHGTCSGLQPADYFELTAKLKKELAIPANYEKPATPVKVSYQEFAQAFKAANPTYADGSILPFCSGGGRFLQEVHACYDKSGKPQGCAPAETKRSKSSCGKATFLLQSVR